MILFYKLQITQEEVEKMREQVIILMSPVSPTIVQCVTHSLFSKIEMESILAKIKYVIDYISNISLITCSL